MLRKELGRGLTSEGVHILDPFTGAGTFINRLLTQTNSQGEPLIADTDLARKFINTHSPFLPGGTVQEIHANEIVLLAYYLAAIKIEEGCPRPHRRLPALQRPSAHRHLRARPRQAARHRLHRLQQRQSQTARRTSHPGHRRQPALVGGPEVLRRRQPPAPSIPRSSSGVRDTYGKRHKEITGRGAGPSSGNLYVQAFRWACDRLDSPDGDRTRPGIVAFVHPNSLSNAPSLIGMRAALREEFSDIYAVNLLGDAMKSGDEYRREGDKIFGQGSRNGVQITVLVRNPDKDPAQPAELHYATVPKYSTREKKFAWLGQLEDVTSDQFETVPVNDAHNWINLTDGSFDELLAVCAVGPPDQRGDTAVTDHARGLATSCDTYVYSFTYDDLVSKMTALIDAYENARHLVAKGTSIEDATRNDELEAIKWTHKLKQSLKNGQEIEFDEARIREVLYRPFTKLWLYEDHRILSQAKATSDLFPRPDAATSERGGGQELSAWHHPTTGRSSERSRPTASPTCAQPERTSPHGSSHGSDHDLICIEHDIPSAGNRHDARYSRSQGIPTDQSPTTLEAILLSSPSTRTTFAVLAVSALPDLHALDPACRAIPRRS